MGIHFNLYDKGVLLNGYCFCRDYRSPFIPVGSFTPTELLEKILELLKMCTSNREAIRPVRDNHRDNSEIYQAISVISHTLYEHMHNDDKIELDLS
jgi:hypothetical protein